MDHIIIDTHNVLQKGMNSFLLPSKEYTSKSLLLNKYLILLFYKLGGIVLT